MQEYKPTYCQVKRSNADFFNLNFFFNNANVFKENKDNTQKKDTIMMIIKKELPSVLAQENWMVTYKP